MPAHLGAMPLSVKCVIEQLKLNRGDTAIVNDPFNGGNHLPDFTVVRPVYLPGSKSPMFYTANRAHHADVGGMSAGSMPCRVLSPGRGTTSKVSGSPSSVRTPSTRWARLTV